MDKKKPDLTSLIDAHLKHYEDNKESIQAQRELEAKENPSCLSKWFPIVSKIPVRRYLKIKH